MPDRFFAAQPSADEIERQGRNIGIVNPDVEGRQAFDRIGVVGERQPEHVLDDVDAGHSPVSIREGVVGATKEHAGEHDEM